ncbi:MAG: hypothetical protein QHJ73_07270, partial [Armatimonadota bacterium]|nr:hypothetical protein [Armatimonadota bacterium]
ATRQRSVPHRSDCDPRLLLPPVELADRNAPPLLAVHSRNDELVRPEESIAVVERLRALGRPATLHLFDGVGKLHGIWDEQEAASPRLLPPLEEAVAAFLRRHGE